MTTCLRHISHHRSSITVHRVLTLILIRGLAAIAARVRTVSCFTYHRSLASAHGAMHNYVLTGSLTSCKCRVIRLPQRLFSVLDLVNLSGAGGKRRIDRGSCGQATLRYDFVRATV
jgi:hypothetical protein